MRTTLQALHLCSVCEAANIQSLGWQAGSLAPQILMVPPRLEPCAFPAGEDTTVLFGFLSTLLNLLELVPPPTHFAVVFDSPGKNFRQGCRRPREAACSQAL